MNGLVPSSYYFLILILKFVKCSYRNAFVEYWINGNMLTMDIATVIFKILKQPQLNYITQVFSLIYFSFPWLFLSFKFLLFILKVH